MREFRQFAAEDGSIWPDAASCAAHERALRGDKASLPDVRYAVVDHFGKWHAFKRDSTPNGPIVDRLGGGDGRTLEAMDAYELVLKDIGYNVPAYWTGDEECEDGFWPEDRHFREMPKVESDREVAAS